MNITVESCITTLGMVPGQRYSFSDHEAVASDLLLLRSSEGKSVSDIIRKMGNELVMAGEGG